MGNASQPEQRKSTTAQRELIRSQMPCTYGAILDKAEEVGSVAYEWVRRGLTGEANCFYAFENGHVVGTPFNIPGVREAMAANMVQFGVVHCCCWHMEASNGAH